jgi:L-ascorbate metabolism protein UlaG (beta-lactamase superfamily)
MKRLENQRTEVIMASQTSDLIRVKRYKKVTELGWGQSARVGSALVQAFEVNHWGARMQTDTYRGYNGYLVEINNRRILFAGDTAITDTFRGVKQRNGVDLAIMPIGAYNPWIRVHCNPEQAWRMGNDAGAEYILPVHHSTFHLSREPLNEPIERLLTVAGSRTERVVATGVGQEFHWS